MQRPSYALALLLASLASCMVIANVAQCQVIVVFHDVSEGTDEPSATVIDSGSNASAADGAADDGSADESNSTDSDLSTPDTLPIDGDEGLSSGDEVTSEEPAVPGESPVQAEIDAGIEGDDSIDQPYHLPDHSRVCPYAGDWLDFGLRDYADQFGNELRGFSTEPSLDERVADVPAPATEQTELRSAEIQAVEEDVINELAAGERGSNGEESFELGNSREAALQLAATFDQVGNLFHQMSSGIREWANDATVAVETSIEEDSAEGYSAEKDVFGESVIEREPYSYDESVDMTEQLE